MRWLPNALTIARLVMIPIFIGLVLTSDGGHSWAAAIVFGIAAITDQVDGWLARRWHVESEFGKVADPLADRLMIDAAVLLLWHAGRLPWVALAIPARDVALVAGYKLVVGRGYDFSVNLAAPVVLHTNNRLGRQIINDAHGYAVREPLFGEVELGDVQATTPRVPVAAHAK